MSVLDTGEGEIAQIWPSARFSKIRSHMEVHSQDQVPDEDRHGKSRDMFTLWFGGQIVFVTVLTGSACAAAGLDFWWIVLGIFLGVAIGTFLTAAHSAQGPALGIPQMIQSRAQFGYFGSIVPLVMALFNFMGFLPLNPAVSAEYLKSMWGLNTVVGIIIIAFLGLILAVFGYKWVHRGAKYASVLGLVVFLVFIGLLIFAHPHIPNLTHATLHGRFEIGPFLTAVVICLTFAISYAPWAADYSRYLPRNCSKAAVGWYSAFGLAIPLTGLFILGAYLEAVSNYSSNLATVMNSVTSRAGTAFTDVFDLVGIGILVLVTAMCAYSSAIILMGIVDSFKTGTQPSLKLDSAQVSEGFKRRVMYTTALSIIGVGAAIAYSENLLGFYSTFLSILVLLIIPWSAVNLADFYFLRHGHYDIRELFNPKGRYGLINIGGLISYCVALGIEFLFCNISGVYESPVARQLSGGDISWVPGVIIGAGLYLILNRHNRQRRSATILDPIAQPGPAT